MLPETARTALETARLGIIRGPVEIGKTFALWQIADGMSQGDDHVFLIEASSHKSKSEKRFYQKALFAIGASRHGGVDPFEVFAGYMLRSYPFRRLGHLRRILLILDECQRRAPNILETLRQAYDAGQFARDGDQDAPAFASCLSATITF